MPQLDITAAGSNSAEWKSYCNTFPSYPPILHPVYYAGFLYSTFLQSCIQRQKVFCLAWGSMCILCNTTAVLNNPTPHTDLWGSTASVLAGKYVHGSLTEHHTPISTSVPLSPSVCDCVCVICLSYRAIIQLQSQLQVARSVIFDKLCWLPHFCCIWQPYTGILMDTRGNRVRAIQPLHLQYIYSLLQN